MQYQLFISEDALEDAAFALEYYMEISFELYFSFKRNFEDALEKVRLTPNNYLNLDDRRHRRYKIKKFPYVLVYEVVDNVVIIKMVFFQKENPQKQTERLV